MPVRNVTTLTTAMTTAPARAMFSAVNATVRSTSGRSRITTTFVVVNIYRRFSEHSDQRQAAGGKQDSCRTDADGLVSRQQDEFNSERDGPQEG
ncbi:hypothetical protein PBRA_005652 [Plasmodiophora brassicae]|uniref:Uncharacterized protein n=1 Tax=Plasmodiophora brassicae TaxID=37360 RepID=A0A0G4IP26_PLABS|nr:hypothetical protein PBRA_005652 [Plasmodiophora brassicae]